LEIRGKPEMLITEPFWSGDLDKETFDYIVVGAGASGCALAAGLTDDASCSVALIESGSHYGRTDQYPSLLQRADRYSFSLQPGQTYPPNPRYSMYTWSYRGQLNDVLSAQIVRGRVVGGSSAINGGEFSRGRPRDYDTWAEQGNPAWSFEAVLPAFRAIETDLDFGDTAMHGSRGPIPVQRGSADSLGESSKIFLEAATSAGFDWDPDLNGMTTGGIGLIPLNVIDGVRQNAGAAFVERVLRRKNLSLLDRTTVRRVLIDKGDAVGVEVTHRGAVRSLHASETVLCASGINSPHLLLNSGIGSPSTLKQLNISPVCELDAVGKNLSDHVRVILPFTMPNRFGAGQPGGGLVLNYSSSEGGDEDLRLLPIPLNRSQHPQEPFVLGFDCTLSAPRSRGDIVLSPRSRTQPPSIRYNYLSEPQDRRVMRESVRLAARLLEDRAYRQAGAEQVALSKDELRDDSALDHWIAGHLCTAYHSSGTCKMGPRTDESSVVDQYCRVRGVGRLRVADVSMAPLIPTRGMHATAVMIGEHAASLLRSSKRVAGEKGF
jgi:choline dehydrogenase